MPYFAPIAVNLQVMNCLSCVYRYLNAGLLIRIMLKVTIMRLKCIIFIENQRKERGIMRYGCLSKKYDIIKYLGIEVEVFLVVLFKEVHLIVYVK